MAKRYHYICRPTLDVVTKKRIIRSDLYLDFFDLERQESLCRTRAVLALPSSGSSIGVPLEEAKMLMNIKPHYLQVFEVGALRSLGDLEQFREHVLARMRASVEDPRPWFAPAGFNRGNIRTYIDAT